MAAVELGLSPDVSRALGRLFFEHDTPMPERLRIIAQLEDDGVEEWTSALAQQIESELEQAAVRSLTSRSHVRFNPNHDPSTGEFSSGGTGSSAAKSLTSDEGYAWHDTYAKQWAEKLPANDRADLESYASFSYGAINHILRGQLDYQTLTKTERRNATSEEMRKLLQANAEGKNADDLLPKGEHFTGFEIEKRVPDTEVIDRYTKMGQRIKSIIAEKGLPLPAPLIVQRAAYIPGLTAEALAASKGKVMTDKGFTSTMLGDANGRLEGYIAYGKAESLYNRHGGKIHGIEEEGSALKINIHLPKGTKVASIEALRRITNGPQERSESEILLKSGAKFRVIRVVLNAGVSKSADFSTPYHEVDLDYIG